MNLPNKKNPKIAGILCCLLCPLGYLYLGLNFMFSAIIIDIIINFPAFRDLQSRIN